MQIKPQAGPQFQFLSTSADIAIYGGSAGGGKSFALLMEFARWYNTKSFVGIIFRRNSVQLRDGGLWDESAEMYAPLGGNSNDQAMTWRFPSGSLVKMAGLQHEKDKFTHQGKQYAVIGFDELTHFSKSQFFYLLSRNRSTCGVKPYIRATCNPDPDSFVKNLIEWWLDDATGLPIKERSGVIRYFFRVGEVMHWADTKDELMENFGVEDYEVKSFTFIPSSIYDNKILLDKDPSYLGNLKAQNKVERERLHSGNWKIRPAAGLYFKKDYFKVVDSLPPLVSSCRGWDLAATPESEGQDPDYTAGVKIGKCAEGNFYIYGAVKKRLAPHGVRSLIKATAEVDSKDVAIFIPQDPGQAGKDQSKQYMKFLAGYSCHSKTMTGDKVTRAGGLSAQCEAGNVYILKGHWNEELLEELEAFPTEGVHDDYVDAAAEAFNHLASMRVARAGWL